MAGWTLWLLAAALSIDALNIGVICGFEGIRIPWRSRWVMMAMTTLCTALAVTAGYFLQDVLPPLFGQILGTVMLLGLGVYMTIGAVRRLRGHPRCVPPTDGHFLKESVELIGEPSRCDADDSKRIELREAAAIGFALSGDSVACGLGAGVGVGLHAVLMPPLCGFFQMLFVWCGGWLADRLRHKKSFRHEWMSLAAGVLLIVMALFRW